MYSTYKYAAQQMWHLGTCFHGGLGIPRLMVELDSLKGLFYESERKPIFCDLTLIFFMLM